MCPGDSGGPLLDVESNGVVGISSGFYARGDDIFGDVPGSRATVDGVLAAWWPRR